MKKKSHLYKRVLVSFNCALWKELRQRAIREGVPVWLIIENIVKKGLRK